MFGKVPGEIKKTNLNDWYSGLSDQDRLRLSRYISGADTSSMYSFFRCLISKALDDDNPSFAVKLCEDAYSTADLNDLQRFIINELLIRAYYDCGRYDDTKAACEANFGLYPKVKEELAEENGGSVPETLFFRNHYINVIVGIESNYDLAFKMLDEYNKMGILSDEDLEFRRNSLTTHRLQRLFDGVYTYRPKEEK